MCQGASPKILARLGNRAAEVSKQGESSQMFASTWTWTPIPQLKRCSRSFPPPEISSPAVQFLFVLFCGESGVADPTPLSANTICLSLL